MSKFDGMVDRLRNQALEEDEITEDRGLGEIAKKYSK